MPWWQWAYDNNDYFYEDQYGYTFSASTNPNSKWYDYSNYYTKSVPSGLSINSITYDAGHSSFNKPCFKLNITISSVGSSEGKELRDNNKPNLSLVYAGPNPTRGNWSIKLIHSNLDQREGEIVFYDITGKRIGKPIKIKTQEWKHYK